MGQNKSLQIHFMGTPVQNSLQSADLVLNISQ